MWLIRHLPIVEPNQPTGAKQTASLVSDVAYDNITNITFYISKASNNTKSAIFNVYVSEDKANWGTAVGSSPNYTDKTIVKYQWTKVSIDLKEAPVTGYVKIEYDGNTAIRLIDDITVTYDKPAATELTAPEITGVLAGETYYGEAGFEISYPELATSLTYTVTKDGVQYKQQTVSNVVVEKLTEVGSYKIEATATDGAKTVSATPVEFVVAEKPAPKGVFVKVANVASLQKGDKVIILSGNLAMKVEDVVGADRRYAETVVLTGDSYEVPFDSQIAIFELNTNAENQFSFKDNSGYISFPSTKDLVVSAVESFAPVTIDESGNAKIGDAEWIQYNASGSMFRFYNTQTPVQIYELKDPNALDVPVISGAVEGVTYFEETRNISITCLTEGAQIYYTVKKDGATIAEKTDAVSPVELPLSEAGVYAIEAMSTKGDQMSEVVTLNFTIATLPFEKMDPSAPKEGTYMIAAKGDDGKYYLMRNSVVAQFYVGATEFDVALGEPTKDTANLFFVEKAEGGYYIKNFDQAYVSLKAGDDGVHVNLKPAEATPFVWTFGGTSDAVQATGESTGVFMQFRIIKGTPQFHGTADPGVQPMFLYVNNETSGVESLASASSVKAVAGGIEVVADKAAEVIVVNAAGQMVAVEAVAGGSTLVELPAGFYIVRVADEVVKVIVR